MKWEISNLTYELYKLDWLRKISIDKQMDELKNYYKGLTDDETVYSFEDYIEEFGYDGELYSSKDEFLENEYLLDNYMKSLLDDEDLYMLYLKDMSVRTYERKKKEVKSKELLKFISDGYKYIENDDETVVEYMEDGNGKLHENNRFSSWHEALLTWKDTERKCLVDNKEILLSESDYELLELSEEYNEVYNEMYRKGVTEK